MRTSSYLTASAVIFTVVALVHLLRAVQGWPVQLGTMMVPVWISALAFVLSAGLAMWGFMLVRRH